MSEPDQRDSQPRPSETKPNSRALISDSISPYIEPLYELIIDDFVEKYKIKLPLYFWFIFSIFIFSLVTLYFKLSYEGTLFLFLLAILILLANNKTLFWNTITKIIRYDKNKVVDEFLADINNKKLDEIKRFVGNNYHILGSNDLILLLESKFFDTPSLHLSILKSQIIDSELLEYMIRNNFEAKIGVDLFCNYLKYCSNSISHTSYEMLVTRNKDNPKIIKTVNACFPFFLSTHGFFKFFANIRISMKESLNYGNTKNYIIVIWFFLFLLAISSQPNYVPSVINQTRIQSSDQMTNTFFLIISYVNFGMSFLIAIFLCSAFTLYVLAWFLRRYRNFLCIVAPSSG